MTAKTSKETSDREKACRFVLAALSQQSQELSQKLQALYQPFLDEGDPVPDFLGTLTALGRGIKKAILEVIRADTVLFTANAALAATRQARSDRTADLSRLIIGLRQACNALFRDLSVQELGFDQRTAQDPVPLLIQAERIVERLRGGSASEVEHVFEGDDFDPARYADQIEQKAAGLREALDAFVEARRHSEKVMLEKRALTGEYDTLFLHGARTFESYCRLVGKADLADRVRPSESRKGRTEIEPEETGSEPGAEPKPNTEGMTETDERGN
ncbi:MAG: hypothetical protein AAF560_20500 [Acidobacteriota bacterium]